MVTRIHVRPARPDLRVYDHAHRRDLPPEGLRVDVDANYWSRRLRKGDVIIVGDAPEALLNRFGSAAPPKVTKKKGG
jgi:hypothetical protein